MIILGLQKSKYYPYGSKIHGTKLSRNFPVRNAEEPKTVKISMSQHIGAPATPTVSVGDKVKKGTLIGAASGAVSANIFSSVAGTVVAIEDLTNGLGQVQKHVVIENDFSGEEEFFTPLTEKTPETMKARIAEAGIVGLGGAGFPTAIKLSPKSPLDVLVINGAECEPYLTCDFRLLLERTEDIYKGIKLLAEILGVNKIVIGIEVNKPEAIEAFCRYEDLTVVPLRKQYPMGSEKHLIYCTTGRKVPCGKMPFDVGACVQNIKTALACYEAVELNKPLTETVLTVSGRGVKQPSNLRVPLGTSFAELIEQCGGQTEGVIKVIAGGPMMGRALENLNQYTRKTDSGILCLTKTETSADEPTNCINCGVCARNCPMRLMPMYIESFAAAGDLENAKRYGAMNCIECGLCAYNCPAKRALVQSISGVKQKIREASKK